MKQVLVILLTMLLFSQLATAHNVAGTVIDGVTKKPVAGAAVYVNESLKYCLSDSAGQFLITGIEDPLAEIVASANGYATAYFQETSIRPVVTIRFEVLPVESSEDLAGSEGNPESQNLFLDYFLGISQNTRDTYILNPEVLRYSFNDTSKELTVTATSMLHIINDGLGYMLNFNLELFILFAEKGTTLTEGSYFFKPLTSRNPQMQAKWILQAQTAYYGSANHFFRALVNNEVGEEGFVVKTVKRISENETGYKQALKSKQAILRKGITNETGKPFIEVADQLVVNTTEIRGMDNAKQITFNTPRNGLVVYYKGRKKLPSPIVLNNDVEMISILHVTEKSVLVQPSGKVMPKTNLQVAGWMNEKISNLLPIDYRP